ALPISTGNVTFFDGGNSLGSAALNQNGQATFNTSTLSVGSHSITASYEGDSTSATSTSSALAQVVGKADQTITFGQLANKSYGDADFTVGAAASSNLAVSFAASGNCTVTGSTVKITGAGSCTITASQGGDNNYNAAADASQTLTISKASSTTTVTVGNATYDGSPHGGTATATGVGGLNQSLTVTYTGRNQTTYGPITTAPTNAGDYTASATFAGDANHITSSESKTLTIGKATPTVTATGDTCTYSGSPCAGSATATGTGGPSNVLSPAVTRR